MNCSVKVTMFKKESSKNSGKTYKIEESKIIDMEINLLQATLIHRDIQQVKAITSMANEKGKDVLNNLLTSKITCDSTEFKGWKFKPNCRWILGGTTIHLAANWHFESLVHFLGLRHNDPKFCQNLINLTSKYDYTPLHVAAVQENALVTRFLIHKKAKIEATNDKKRTALHLAVQSGSINNIITLMYDGLACLIDQDHKGETPLHLAKTSKILNILLSKVKAQELVSIEESYEKSNEKSNEKFNEKSNEKSDEKSNEKSDEKSSEKSLFNQILLKHPKSMKNYLDVMLTSQNTLHSQNDLHLIFDFSIFNHGTKEKQNYLDKHLALIKNGCPEMLRHPVMALFAYTKWAPHKMVYYINFVIFLAFLVVFTYHGYITIDLIQCELTKSNDTWIENPKQKECQDELLMDSVVTRYISCCLLGTLILWEFAQFISKILENEIREYFSVQNITEGFMYALCSYFFVIDFIDFKETTKSKQNEYQSSVLGWALFLAWTDLTIFLGRFNLFGGNIYTTWRVAKNVFWPLMVYIPSIMAFSTAFHCFLSHNPVFEGSVSSVFKVLTMVLGEYDFEDNFLFDKVMANDGYISVQVTRL